ncbi:MAG TPA: hypothetical protein VNL92_05990, partial [Dehalococcoidia bacterium]|nr:hypothetical protein [Dehalococcoidia bacterium]
MIRILYGPDTYSRTIALNRIRSELNADTADEVRFDASVGMEQLLAALHTLPFLATRRVVIVDGLLARAQPPRRGASRTRARGSTRRDTSGLFWAPLADAAPTLPPSTELILVDDAIDSDNPLLTALTPYAEVRQFRPLAQRDVPGWITARARDIGVRLAPDAVRLLADLCGNNLWAAESELEKLHLY